MLQAFAFSQGGVTGTELILSIETTEKLCKIHETMMFRYWTSESTRWDSRNKQGGPYDCAMLLRERACRPQSRVGESRQRLENSMSS